MLFILLEKDPAVKNPSLKKLGCRTNHSGLNLKKQIHVRRVIAG